MENLDKKDFIPESVVKEAISNLEILSRLVNNIIAKNDTIRYNSHKALLLISENYPETLYPKWDFFVELLKSKNNFHIVIGIQILANIAKVDSQNKFQFLIDQYCDLIDTKSVMTSAHLASNLGKIAKYKPELREKIIKVLLSIDNTHHEQDRKDLIKASAIKSFMDSFSEIKENQAIIDFIKGQLKSNSPKTRNLATEFLKKFNNN